MVCKTHVLQKLYLKSYHSEPAREATYCEILQLPYTYTIYHSLGCMRIKIACQIILWPLLLGSHKVFTSHIPQRNSAACDDINYPVAPLTCFSLIRLFITFYNFRNFYNFWWLFITVFAHQNAASDCAVPTCIVDFIYSFGLITHWIESIVFCHLPMMMWVISSMRQVFFIYYTVIFCLFTDRDGSPNRSVIEYSKVSTCIYMYLLYIIITIQWLLQTTPNFFGLVVGNWRHKYSV